MDNFVLNNPNLLQIEEGYSHAQHTLPSLRCPHCRHIGVFSSLMPSKTAVSYSKRGTKLLSQTVFSASFQTFLACCPNRSCQGIVLVTSDGSNKIKIVMPPELIDFSTDGLPDNLVRTLEEAVKCHAYGSYRAAAMMVRRLLEEICELNQAEGSTLHARLLNLKSKVVLPETFFDAMGELKALGNDAAHVEAKTYDNIGEDEAADSIELAKEILKALYQLQGLVSRLQARKKTNK